MLWVRRWGTQLGNDTPVPDWALAARAFRYHEKGADPTWPTPKSNATALEQSTNQQAVLRSVMVREPTPTGLAGKMSSMWSMRDLSAGPTQERGSQVLALAGVSTSRAESGGLGGADAGSKRSSGSSAGQLGNELNRRLMLTRRVSRWQRMTRCRCVAGPACRKGSARLR